MIRVVNVEKMRPKIIVLAIGPQTTDSPPRPSAVGTSPAMVVREVSRIGRRRVTAALVTAGPTAVPSSRRDSLAKDMSTIVSLTAIPARATLA